MNTNKIVEKLRNLSAVCDEDERELIEEMVHNAADYVRQVVIMESTAINFAGRKNDEFRDKVAETDTRRSLTHNNLISMVNVVNRIAQLHDHSLIYTGENHRRCDGDFAIKLVDEIFNSRT